MESAQPSFPSRTGADLFCRVRARRAGPGSHESKDRGAPPRRANCLADRGWPSAAAASALHRADPLAQSAAARAPSKISTDQRLVVAQGSQQLRAPHLLAPPQIRRNLVGCGNASKVRWINNTLATPAHNRVLRNLARPVVHAHTCLRYHDAYALTDQAPRYRVGVGVNLNHAVGSDLSDQIARCAEWKNAGHRLQSLGLVTLKAADRCLTRSAMNAHISHLAYPRIEVSLQRSPACEAPAGDGVLLYITNAVLRLAFGAGAVGCTCPRAKAPVLGKSQQLVIEHNASCRGIVLNYQSPSIVKQNLLGNTAKS